MAKKNKVSKTVLKRIAKINVKNGKVYVRATTAQHLASNKSKRARKKSGNLRELSAADTKRIRKII